VLQNVTVETTRFPDKREMLQESRGFITRRGRYFSHFHDVQIGCESLLQVLFTG
jgi:hypothetical protein